MHSTSDNLCGDSCCSLVFTVYRQTDCLKIAAGRDFLGGLAPFIFTAGSRLAALFSRLTPASLKRYKNHSTSSISHCRVSSPADTAGSHAHKQDHGILESCVIFCL